MTPEHRFRLIDHLAAEAIARLSDYPGPMDRPNSPNPRFSLNRSKEVREEGVQAFAAGIKFEDNPYPKHGPDHASWMRGWIDAEVPPCPTPG